LKVGSERHLATCRAINFASDVGSLIARKEDEDWSELDRLRGAPEKSGVVRSLTADKGSFALEEIAQIQEFDIRTVIGDAHAARRRKQRLAAPLRKALHRAASAVKSQSGKAFLRKRQWPYTSINGMNRMTSGLFLNLRVQG
jgi:hypothetical protein